MSYKWTDTETASRPSFNEMVKIELAGKQIDPLLYKLLTTSSPYGTEEPVAKIIVAWAKKCGVDVANSEFLWFSEKEQNLIIDLRLDDTHTTMFSCHMDTMQDNAAPIELWMTTSQCKAPGEGFIFAAKSKMLYTLFDYDNPAEVVSLHPILQKERIYNYNMYLDKTKKNGDKVLATIWEQPYNGPEKDSGLHFWAKKSHTVRTPATLGADDKIGCYIMCKLIEAGVNGLYVFHVGEERGCKGSKYFSEAYADFLTGKEKGTSSDGLAPVQRCIAFDRGGYTDVISKQRSGNTCSAEFTEDLAKALNKNISATFSWFKPDIQGVYTDSAEYKDIIPECTNLSVGYFRQHGPGEHTDYIWLESIFLPAALKVQWDELKTYRNPKKTTTTTTNNSTRSTLIISPNLVAWNTSLMQCPKWEPENGLMSGASEYGMKRIIESHLAIDARTDYLKISLIYNMAKDRDKLREELVNVYTYLSMKGISKKDIEKEIGPVINGTKTYISDDDPNGSFEKDDQTTVEEMLGEQFCTNCQYVISQCSCNETISPRREDFDNEALFQVAIAEYTMRAYPQTKTMTVQDILSDEDIKARLEK